MKLFACLSLLICLQMSCRKKKTELKPIAPSVVEKTSFTYGRDGGNIYSFTYNHRRQLIRIIDKDVTLGMNRPELFTELVRNEQGVISKITRQVYFAQAIDTVESAVSYQPNGNINYVISVQKATRDSIQYVYASSAIHADTYRWDQSVSQYVYLHRTSFEVANGNIQSIKLLSPNAQQPFWTKTYEYDQMVLPFVTDFTEAVLTQIFEGQVTNNITKRIYTYTDPGGNVKTETLLYSYTYKDDKRPLKAEITGVGYSNLTYIYK